MMMANPKSIALAILAFATLPLSGGSYSYGGMTWTDTVSPGQWTSKYADAKAYAKKNNTPMVVVWANPGCYYCGLLESAIGDSAVKTWAAKRRYVMVFALGVSTRSEWGITASDGAAAEKFASGDSLTQFPFVGIWWPKKSGGEVKTRFTGRSGSMPSKSGSLAQQFMDSVDRYVGAYASVAPKTVTVSFNANGGSNLSEKSRVVASGKAVGTLPTATRTGYKLAGWATAASGGSPVTSSTKVTGNATYYAQWKKLVELLLVTDTKYAGTLIGGGQYDEGSKVVVKAMPKSDYIFSCWKNGSTVVTKEPKFTYTLDNANVMFTAYFISKTNDLKSLSLKVNNVAMKESITGNATLEQGINASWPVEATALTAATPSVSGLPSGLKLVKDKATGKYTITGVPTAVSKADKYGNAKPSNVTIKVKTSGGNTKTYKMAIAVKARPEWTEGVFNGYAGTAKKPDGLVYNLTVAANGKISGKLLRDGKTYSLSASSLSSAYRATIVGKSGKESISLNVVFNKYSWGGAITATDNTMVAFWTPWKTNDKLKALAKTIAKAKPLPLSNGVTLKFGASGVVTVKYGSYSSSSVLIPLSETPTTLDLCPYLAPKAGKFDGYCDVLTLKWDGAAFSL